jgi:hypothetical protein
MMKTEYIFTAITALATILTVLIGVLTAITGVFVAYVGYNQYRISKERFKLDLFDKRFSVYKGVQVFLTYILHKLKVDLSQIVQFRVDTQDSVFLFGYDITEYLKKIDSKSCELLDLQEERKNLPVGEENSKKCKEQTELIKWFTDQLPELKKIFSPYLRFKTWKP